MRYQCTCACYHCQRSSHCAVPPLCWLILRA
jgi:hypothetical protein